jgi:rhamnosyltransferase
MLSTWNGERFLKEQIDSVLSQSFDGEIKILIRDDGSSDGTIGLIEAYSDVRITLLKGINVGAKESYLMLMSIAKSIDVDYYALCDQDDVWCVNKISRAVGSIRNYNSPALYCGSVELVDQYLNHLSIYKHPGNQTFSSLLFLNCATGCTCLFNRSLLERLRFPSDPSFIFMHDWWIALSASALGVIHYDDVSYIKYRQHGNNHVGIKTGFRSLIHRVQTRIRALSVPSRVTQARSFINAYNEILCDSAKMRLFWFLKFSSSPFGRLRVAWFVRKSLGIVTLATFVLFG